MDNQLEKQNQLILVDEDGTEVLCNILFTSIYVNNIFIDNKFI